MTDNRHLLVILAFFISVSAQMPAEFPIRNQIPPNIYYRSPGYSFDTCEMKVYFKDGTSLTKKNYRLSIKTSPKYNGQCLIIDTMKVLPSQTDSLLLYALVGIPYKNSWIWRVIEGKLSVFSSSRTDDPWSYVQVGKGDSLQQFSRISLKKALADNPEASRLERSYTWGVNSTIVMAMASIGFMMALVSTQYSDNQNQKLVFLGAGVTFGLGAVITRKVTKKNREKAIYVYNNKYYK